MLVGEARESDHFRHEGGEWWYYPPNSHRSRAVTGKCRRCGGDFVRTNAANRSYDYCGNECYREDRRERRTVGCDWCGGEFLRGEQAQRFCSLDCYWSWNTGDNHWKFDNYSRDQYRKLRSEAEGSWVRNRQRALERDNFTCLACGQSQDDGAYLDVHHIEPILAGGTNRLDNLATCCRACHQAIESRGHSYVPDDWNLMCSPVQLEIEFAS